MNSRLPSFKRRHELAAHAAGNLGRAVPMPGLERRAPPGAAGPRPERTQPRAAPRHCPGRCADASAPSRAPARKARAAASSSSSPPRGRNGPRTRNVQSTGTIVTASSVAPIMAKVLAKASGWNSLPSSPTSVNTGMKARMMISMAKKMGRPTCCAASSVTCQDLVRREAPVAAPGFQPLAVPDDVLGHDDAGIHQHADGDGDAAQRHDVRGDAKLLHQDERDQDRNRQRQGHDQDAAEMPEEDDVRQRHQEDLLRQRALQRGQWFARSSVLRS